MTTSDDSRALTARAVAARRVDEPGALLPVLHEVQAALGHLEREDIAAIADVLNLSIADVHGVVSFYHDFRTTPPADHSITLCRAEACQAVGSHPLFDEVTADFAGRPDVEVREVFCLGNCALGPSGTIDGVLHGRLDRGRVAELTSRWSP